MGKDDTSKPKPKPEKPTSRHHYEIKIRSGVSYHIVLDERPKKSTKRGTGKKGKT